MIRVACLFVAVLCTSAVAADIWAQSASPEEPYGKPGSYFIRPRDAPPPPDPLAALAAEARRAAERQHEEAWRTDRARMIEFGIAGSREAAVLTLPLDGDRVVHLVDNVEDCAVNDGCLAHAFDGAIGDRYLVVSVLAYETSWSYVIDRRAAVVHQIAATPVLSADEGFGVAWSRSDLDVAVDIIFFEPAGALLEHVEIDDSCGQESSWTAELALAWDPVRIDPDTIELRGETEPAAGALLTRLERRDSRWRALCSRK